MQAGSRESGKGFAARYAEAVFTAEQTLEEGIAFYEDVKRHAEPLGRDPEYAKRQLARIRFNIMPAVLPSGLEVLVDRVVPILQERGLFRTGYTGSTLREHHGLPTGQQAVRHRRHPGGPHRHRPPGGGRMTERPGAGPAPRRRRARVFHLYEAGPADDGGAGRTASEKECPAGSA